MLVAQLNEAQLSYSSIGGRFPHRPPGASVPPSRFQLPGQIAFPLQPHRMPVHSGAPTLYHGHNPPTATLGGNASGMQAGAAVSAAASKHQQPGQAADMAMANGSNQVPKPISANGAAVAAGARGSSWASNAPGSSSRDATPMPRTPATPEAAPRAHPAATARTTMGQAGGGSGKPAALAAVVFSSGQRPIYRCSWLICPLGHSR